DNLLQRQQSFATMGGGNNRARSVAPTAAQTVHSAGVGDYGLGIKGDSKAFDPSGILDPELAENKSITEQPTSKTRRIWVSFVWALNFFIPSVLLRHIGRMKRPDVRIAWREKFVLVFVILLINALISFWIIGAQNVICPGWDAVWNRDE